MQFRSALLLFALIALALPSFAIQLVPTVTESSPAPNAEFTTAPQLIPYRIAIDYLAIAQEGNRRGEGAGYGGGVNLISVSDPQKVFTFNEMELINRSSGMDPYGTLIVQGDIASKRLAAGDYKIRANFRWNYGRDPYSDWNYEIPIRLTGGEPAATPPSTFGMSQIAPAQGTRIRYPSGTENSFHVEIRLPQETPGKSVVSFGHTGKIVQVENPDLAIGRELAEFREDWMGPMGLTKGDVNAHRTLPLGHYNLEVTYTWRGSTPERNPLQTFEYTDRVSIPFEVYDPANDRYVIERVLPQNVMIPGVLFPSRLLADPRSDNYTGLVITETLPPELEYVRMPAETQPEKDSNPLVWLLRDQNSVPFTQVMYGLKVREGTAPGTIIRMAGTGEILGTQKPIGGDATITVAGENLSCPIPNQMLLGFIDNWGRFVRDDLRPQDPIVDDMALLQIIEKWRNCLRGGN